MAALKSISWYVSSVSLDSKENLAHMKLFMILCYNKSEIKNWKNLIIFWDIVPYCRFFIVDKNGSKSLAYFGIKISHLANFLQKFFCLHLGTFWECFYNVSIYCGYYLWLNGCDLSWSFSEKMFILSSAIQSLWKSKLVIWNPWTHTHVSI